MKIIQWFSFLVLISALPAADGAKPGILLMFWNVENYFAPGKDASHNLTPSRFRAKSAGIAKTIFLVSNAFGRLPDLVGLAEVGDAGVLRRLTGGTALRRRGYSFIHYDSPDRRGIYCALLYRNDRFRCLFSKPCHIPDGGGGILPTRDILLSLMEDALSGDTLAVLVNHHPSKIGTGSGMRRALAMERLFSLRDSLLSEGVSRIVAVGDFNDSIEPASGVEPAYSLREGTIKFQGRWEKIDGCPVLEGLSAREHIFDSPYLLEADKSHSGQKPRRTFIGPRYLGGLSDHLPIVLEIQNK